MTDTLDQKLVNAGLALLAADPGLTVYDGFVPPNSPRPYVLVYTSVEWVPAPGDGLDGASTSPVVRWYCHCVGETATAARAVAQRVRTQLLDQRPVIPSAPTMTLGLVRFESGVPPVKDETTGVLVMDTVTVYKLAANT